MSGKAHLLVVTRWLLNAGMIFCLIIEAILAVALAAVAVAWTGLDHGAMGIPAILEGGIPRNEALSVGAMALAAGLLIFVLVLLVLFAVRAIVETAIGGDPFVQDNARRLTRIGWLLVVLFAFEWSASAAVNSAIARMANAHHAPPGAIGHFDMGSDISPLSLLAILLVFVLAQIFRHGSTMRAELEGMV
jgi:hypothetical protein